MTVRFTPVTLGLKTAALAIASNDLDENPYNISLTGTGSLPEIVIEQPLAVDLTIGSSRDFGIAAAGSSVDMDLIVRNTGGVNLTIPVAFWNGSPAAFTLITPLPLNVPGGSNAVLTLRFSPTGTGAVSDTLHIINNDQGESPFNINFTGTGGVPPDIVVEQHFGINVPDGGSRDFGTLDGGNTSSRTFTIRNTGAVDLTGLGMSFSGPDAALFSVTLAPVAPIAPAGSCTFIVRFAPVTAGFRTAALHLVSNDADENPFDIQLTGIGTALPTATTLSAASGTPTTATLNATVHPRGLATAVHFDYGTSDLYGSVTPTINLAAGATTVAIAAPITGLLANTNYHFRVVADSSSGTRQGTDASFGTRNDMLTVEPPASGKMLSTRRVSERKQSVPALPFELRRRV